MNNFDDIFDTTVPGEQPFDKDAWAERKQAERQAVYDLADATAADVCADGAKFQAYLDTQARFDRYSVTNVLLIMAQMPAATQIKDFEAWKAVGASIKRQQKGFSILEPGNEYRREDGTIGTSYNVKKVFDISQTTARVKIQPAVSIDERPLLKALIYHPPVPIQTVDELLSDAGALYDHEQQVIFVRRGMGATDIFRSVSMELAHAEIATVKSDYTREGTAFSAYCVSYILCKKYGVDVAGYDFSTLPDTLCESDPQTQRAALTEIRDTAANISARMSRALEARSQQPKEQER
ncbi:MAG: hypothetical protein HFE91_11380 [Acutalibacter sp.]|jgi:hypothetical protein|uniref:hypothetical protein n=1 Tax=Acutalibacter sp. TaxID=1918636 RepID=UPI0021706F1E|nr:hypothetical protein [Acutalibacter sp.]MCI9226047.1 hypothetical protein [Acutalibacter sp.]